MNKTDVVCGLKGRLYFNRQTCGVLPEDHPLRESLESESKQLESAISVLENGVAGTVVDMNEFRSDKPTPRKPRK